MKNISVIMSAFKEPVELFTKSVKSIQNQTYSDFELIIVLDCPSNSDLKRAIELIAKEDTRIRPIWNEANIGLAMSLNKALTIATGQYICRMDADDIALPNRIEQQLSYLVDNNLDLIGCYVKVIDEKGDELFSVQNIPTENKQLMKAIRWNNCIPHPTWFGKKEFFNLGYRNIPLCEDYDLILRASRNGMQMGNCPTVLVEYRMNNESVSRTNLYRQFLYQKYLTYCFSRQLIVEPNDASAWVQSHFSEEKSRAYSCANSHFNQGLNHIRNNEFAQAVRSLIGIPIISKEYMSKVFRMIVSTMHGL